MIPEDTSSMINIIAFGCDHYDNLKGLSNVNDDLSRLKEVLCMSEYSIYTEDKYTQIYDGTSSDVRAAIQHYIFSRSAEQDILILFFSGHGTAIGRDDFGFCMRDAVLHPEDGIILPTSVIKLSEIIGTLNIKDVSLVLVVDACYSGQISKQLTMAFPEIASEMSKNLVAYSGNRFALITSCSDGEQVHDIGSISKALKDICEQGIEFNDPCIPLSHLSETITQRIDQHAQGDSRSRVFIPGGVISRIPIAKNVQYFERPEPVNIYSFTNPYLKLLVTLWNDGKILELSPNEILEKTGSQSAYANHNKLSFSPWALMKSTRNNKRTLSQRGIEFLQGKIKIPKTIKENKNTRKCEPVEGSLLIMVTTDKDMFGEHQRRLVEISGDS